MSGLADVDGGPLSLPYDSIFACIEDGLLRNPESEAVVSRGQRKHHLSALLSGKEQSSHTRGEEGTCLRWTYRQFHAAALALAEGLAQRMPSPNSTVITLVPNSVEWLLLLSASVLAKFGIACLDRDLLREPRHAELESRIVEIQPSVIVVEDALAASAADRVLRNLKIECLIKVSFDAESLPAGGGNGSWVPFADLCYPIQEQAALKRTDDARSDSPNRNALIIYTSGTTGGKPKGCIRDVHSLITTVAQQTWNRPGDKGGRRALQTTNFRVIAPICALRAWYDGATIVLIGNAFNPESFLDAIEQERLTEAVLLPAQLHSIAATPALESRDLSSFRLCISGGDIVTSSLVGVSKRLFPQAAFMTAFGMSECGGVFDWPYWGCVDSIPYHFGISPIGRPGPGARVRLMSDDGRIVARGEVGALHIRHDSILKSYMPPASETEGIYIDKQGRWMDTGDLGLINDVGDVYVVGRSKDVIKRAAISISPAAIESCLQTYTGSQTVVLGRPHSTLGQEPFAVLQSFNGHSATEVAAHVIETCGPDCRLGGVIELQALDLEAFPTNATGKIQKSVLAAALDASPGVEA